MLKKMINIGIFGCEHCLVTGHSESMNNIKVLNRDQECDRRKVKEAIYIKQQGPSMIRDTYCPPSTPVSFRQYLGQDAGNHQCVIKTTL